MTAAEWIAKRRKEQAEAYDCAEAYSALPKALDALEAVLELHRPLRSLSNYHRCEECSRLRAEDAADAFWEYWPCDTVTAITTALGADHE